MSAPKAELFAPAALLLALKEEALLSLLIKVEVPGVSIRLLPALPGVTAPLLAPGVFYSG